MIPANALKSFGHAVLARAFWILAFFTLLLVATFPSIPSEPPYPNPNYIPVLVVLVLGAVTWMTMFVACVWAFCTESKRPSVITSVAFFLIFGSELLFAAGDLWKP
jgi:hypothetical protein